MSTTRVLRVYHSAVVDEYRQRERLLRTRYGYDVHLVCPPVWPEGGSVVAAKPDSEVPLHVVDVRGPRHPALFWYSVRGLRRVLREVRPHILDLQEEPYSLAVAGALWAARREAPDARVCVYTAQNIYKRYPPPFRQLERLALSRAVAAYPCSTEAGRVLCAKGFRGRLQVLPLGVSLPSELTGKSDGALRVGFVGRLEPYKGGADAIEAFARANAGMDATLEFVGSGSQESALRARAKRLGLGTRVVFRGAIPQEDALERIASYDVLLVPSLTTEGWKEQFGRVAAQAMVAGTVVLASDSGALPELVEGVGELFREGDVADLAAKLERLLGDGERRAKLAAQGRERARSQLSWEEVVRGCDEMYRQVLGTEVKVNPLTVSSPARTQ